MVIKSSQRFFRDDKSPLVHNNSIFEILAYMDIPVCLDNIAVRGKWNAFVPNLINKKTGFRVESEENYNKLDKGKKLQFIDDHGCFQGFIQILANSNIRNGIGHKNIRFDGETQQLFILDRYDPGKVKEIIPLISVAVDCAKFIKSAIVS